MYFTVTFWAFSRHFYSKRLTIRKYLGIEVSIKELVRSMHTLQLAAVEDHDFLLEVPTGTLQANTAYGRFP